LWILSFRPSNRLFFISLPGFCPHC
jgi:hypothetical protein